MFLLGRLGKARPFPPAVFLSMFNSRLDKARPPFCPPTNAKQAYQTIRSSFWIFVLQYKGLWVSDANRKSVASFVSLDNP